MAKKKSDEEEEMVMVGLEDDGQEEDDQDEDSESPDGEEKKKKKLNAKVDSDEESEEEDDSEEGEDDDDGRVGHAEASEEEDDKARKRRERQHRKEKQRRARERNDTEIRFLRQQNETLERRIREIGAKVERSEVGSIDQRISSAQAQLKVADQVLARAHEDGTGDDVVEATNIRDSLKDTLGKLTNAKAELQRQTSERPVVDSRLIYHARSWMEDNPWYDPEKGDKDSRVVALLDEQLGAAGFNPATPEYWEELTRRAKKKLPHRFTNGRDDADEEDDGEERVERNPRKRGSGPRFSTGGRERPLRKNEVYVDPERKQALIDAGVWDDKVLRNRYLKKYAEWDRENGGRRSAR